MSLGYSATSLRKPEQPYPNANPSTTTGESPLNCPDPCAITAFCVPTVIQSGGSQPYQSLLASLEILSTTTTTIYNAVVIASFVRDKGAKRPKFEREEGYADMNASMLYSTSRRATITRFQWGSGSDLAGDLGIRLDPVLCSSPVGCTDTAQTTTHTQQRSLTAATGTLDPDWLFQPRHRAGEEAGPPDDDSATGISPTQPRKNSAAPLMSPLSDSPLPFHSRSPRLRLEGVLSLISMVFSGILVPWSEVGSLRLF